MANLSHRHLALSILHSSRSSYCLFMWYADKVKQYVNIVEGQEVIANEKMPFFWKNAENL